MKRLHGLTALVLTAALLLSLAASALAAESKVVNVGTEAAYPPFNYTTESGDVDGYDVAVIRSIDELIPEVTFEFVPTAWDSIFVALESGKFDIIANQINKNPAREEKYQFSALPYSFAGNSIIFKAGRTDIKTIKDLHGKTVAAGVGSYNTTWLEEYNAKNGNPISIAYYDGNISLILQDIVSGRVDATLNSEVTTKLIADELKLDLGYVLVDDTGITEQYLLFSKSDTSNEIKPLVDAALKTLVDNGTLSELSKKYLGADYSTLESVKAILDAQKK
jgi:L-cystine transport system substrate-binding protein